MKKIITIFLSLLIITSCNNKINDGTIETNENNSIASIEIKALKDLNQDDNTQTKNNNFDNIESSIRAIPETVKKNSDFSESIKNFIENETLSYTTSLAIEKKDVTICEELHGDTKISDCKNSYFLTIAITSKELEMCQKISGTMKESCLNSVTELLAKTEGDAKICETITLEEAKTECKDSVLFELARKENKPEKCEFIQDEFEQVMCKDSFIDNITE